MNLKSAKYLVRVVDHTHLHTLTPLPTALIANDISMQREVKVEIIEG